ncbi:MAG: hypothetical protein M3R02_06890 [Chloroflexota bacterium]|nr:hypothetical protein [Chloroflexota bacterium]
MSIPDDDDERTGHQTPEEAEFLEAYRELDDAGRAWLRRTSAGQPPPRGGPAREPQGVGQRGHARYHSVACGAVWRVERPYSES